MSAAHALRLDIAEKHVYNHDIMHCTAVGVVGNHLYSGRALGITEPCDIIQLIDDIKPLWPAISSHYDRIGLSHSKQVVWHVEMTELSRHVGHSPSVFYFGPIQSLCWGDHDWLESVDFINSKNNFIDLANQLGVPIPVTTGYENVGEIDDEIVQSLEFPCYLKAAVSVAGVGIYRCKNKEELIEAREQFQPDVPVQIQQEVVTDIFLNLQYQVINGQAVRLACTEQILDQYAHQGNRYPASHEPWEQVEPMAQWLVDKGIKGIFAFDVAVVEAGGQVQFLAIECNPRFNGASYPTIVANKLNIPQWEARTYSTGHRSFKELDLSGLEFDPQQGSGVVVINWGTLLAGKLVLLLAGDQEQIAALDIELKSRL